MTTGDDSGFPWRLAAGPDEQGRTCLYFTSGPEHGEMARVCSGAQDDSRGSVVPPAVGPGRGTYYIGTAPSSATRVELRSAKGRSAAVKTAPLPRSLGEDLDYFILRAPKGMSGDAAAVFTDDSGAPVTF